MPSRALTVAVVGLGRWGGRVARAFAATPRCRVAALCDVRADRLTVLPELPPSVLRTTQITEALAAPGVQAAVIVTGAEQHTDHCLAALGAGKHVFVEKPLALSASEARRIAREVERTHMRLMVGQILEYHPAFVRLRAIAAAGGIGELLHASCQRLGRCDAARGSDWWSLAPHDLGMLRALLGEPSELRASYRDGRETSGVIAELAFLGGQTARIEVAGSAPEKTRRLTVFGSERVAVFDDQDPTQKLRIYARSGRASDPNLGLLCETPELERAEPLACEVEHFVTAVLDELPLRTDVRAGVSVVELLETGQRSLDRGGPELLSIWKPATEPPVFTG
jgi:UDP-2-acetamido-3-amino-2,3-dideoxy-glucuronate N-acetyltransferase